MFFSNEYIYVLILLVIIVVIVSFVGSGGGYSITEIPNFLTPEECDQLVALSEGNLIESRVYDPTEVKSLDYSSRKSEQCWLTDSRHPTVAKFSKLATMFTNTHGKYQEPLQVVKYDPGGFFKPHYDACETGRLGDEYCEKMDKANGPRLVTVLVYLSDEFTGGETHFPYLKRSVIPQKGKAVVFYNIDSNKQVIDESMHGGNPVTSGTKWVANKWIHY